MITGVPQSINNDIVARPIADEPPTTNADRLMLQIVLMGLIKTP
jgi:hypothetical protein